jgi:hypothetical protein
MKKVLLTLSALSILLVSCKKNEMYGYEVEPVIATTTLSSPVVSTVDLNAGCTMWEFTAGPNETESTGKYIPCGSATQTTFKLPKGNSVKVCLREPNGNNGLNKSLSGIDSKIKYISECSNLVEDL